MERSPRNFLLKKNTAAASSNSSSYTNTAPSAGDATAVTVGPITDESQDASILHVGTSTTPAYQSELPPAEQAAMRKILASRSCDLVPSRKNEVNLFERAHIGLLINYACIGFLNGLLPSIVYPFFKLYLNMDSYQMGAAAAIIDLPWSYKTFFGVLSDHYPIMGYRRKSYILIGWSVCFVALMVLAYSPKVDAYYAPGEIQRTKVISLRAVQNAEAPKAGAVFLIELMVVSLGYVITDVACDGIMVELAQHEHIDVRGSAQSTIYIVRYTGGLVGVFVAALGFNGSAYGGSFDWSLPYDVVFFACAIVAVVASAGTVCYLVEEAYYPELDRHPFREMWRIVKQRAIWQLMAFHFLNTFFNRFGFSGYSAIKENWVGIEPLSNNLATCFSILLFVVASVLVKKFFLNTSWRCLIFTCSLFSIVTGFVVDMIVTFDVLRNQWFYLGGPQLTVIPDGMRQVVSGFVTVEIAEHGFEGATYSLLTTVHNLASPFASSMQNLVDANFAVTDKDIATDSSFVRWQVAICIGISTVMQLASLLTLPLLPNQKLEAQELKYHGVSSRLAGVLALLVAFSALAWSTIVNLLAIHSSTACLIIAGGQGC